MLKILIFAFELHGKCLDSIDSALKFLMQLGKFFLELLVLLLKHKLELLDFILILQLNTLEGLYKFLKNINKRFSLVILLNVRLLIILIDFHLLLQNLPQLLILIDQHFHLTLNLLIIVAPIGPIIIQLLNRFSQLRINPDKLLERLLQNIIFFLQFLVTFLEFLVLTFSCEVVFESVCHLCLMFYFQI